MDTFAGVLDDSGFSVKVVVLKFDFCNAAAAVIGAVKIFFIGR